jgi:hypothetical protein
MLNLVQHLTRSRTYETLKRPMKQVQGMVQGDRLGLSMRPPIVNYFLLQPVRSPIPSCLTTSTNRQEAEPFLK